MTDVLIGQAYHLRFDPKLWQAMQPYPPLGSLYAAALVRQIGLDVAVHDSVLADGVHEWHAAVERTAPRYAVLFEDNFNYLTKMCLTRMRDAALEMVDSARRRGALVIVCGSDASDHPDRYLKAGASYVIRGEGDLSLRDLLMHLEQGGSDAPNIGSLSFLAGGERVDTPQRAVMRDLDALPRPAWDLINIDRYRRTWLRRHDRFSLNLVTTRGCPYHCNWCAKPLWGQRYNSHSASWIADQIAWLQAQWAPDHIWFMDDIMGLKKGWFDAFANELERRRISIRFKCLSRADLLLRDGEIDALARAGCDTVWIGAESGAQSVLDAMDKGTKVEQIYEASARLHAAGVGVAFFLQFGYPGEGRAEIAATRRMIRDCRPDDIGISVAYPLPGTRFHEMVRGQLGDKQNWADSGDLAMMFEGPFATPFYRQLHTVIHKEYRSHKLFAALADGTPSDRARRHRPTISPRAVARAAWDRATLRIAEHRLDRLATVPHVGINRIDGALGHAAAATPSPQNGVGE